MHIDELFQQEAAKIKALSIASRQQFLAIWFPSEASRIIGQDPTRRGHFARETEMTSKELRAWGSAKWVGPGRQGEVGNSELAALLLIR